MIDPKIPRSLYMVARALRENLKARRYPYHNAVVAGPEHLAREAGANAVILLHDVQSGDQFGWIARNQKNPKGLTTRSVGAVAYLFARSPKPGAAHHDHVEEVEKLLDFAITGLDEFIRGDLGVLWEITGGRFLYQDEISAVLRPDIPAGSVYELKFRVARPVQRLTWDDHGQDVFQITSVDEVNTTFSANGHAVPVPASP